MRDLLRSPSAEALVVGAAFAALMAGTRHAPWAVYVTPLVFWLCTEAGQFDGQRHVNQKFDATFFVWVQSVELRALAGIVLVALAAPIGAAAGRLVPFGRGARLGLAALGPYGACLVASSARILREVPRMLGLPARDEKLAALRAVVMQADAILAGVRSPRIAVCSCLTVALLRTNARAETR